jgi:micrococcal nuclease
VPIKLRSRPKGAPEERLFYFSLQVLFIFVLFALPVCWGDACWGKAVQAGECGLDRVDERVHLQYIIDGDTVKLTDGRKIRLIGINTPEIEHDDLPPQPYSKQARDDFVNLLRAKKSKLLLLRFDRERHDQYNRLLAHVFLEDGTNVQEYLLGKGAGFWLAIPPNLWQMDCYRHAEQQAKNKQRGVWGLRAYRPVSVQDLSHFVKGFHLIQGRVKKIGISRKSVWLNLSEGVSLRIAKKDLHYFKRLDLQDLKNRTVLARGWLHLERKNQVMRIRHPAALEVLNNNE